MPVKNIRHFFIFNPAAGKRGARARLDRALSALDEGSYTLHVTNGTGDAAGYVRGVCEKEAGPLRFYACGGDGTLGEVAAGALGHPQAEIGVWPCGSGNDYVKYYGGAARFLDLRAQVQAESLPVDLMQAGDRCAVNAINAGLEAHAANAMLRLRHRPGFGGKNGYLAGTADAVLRHMRTRCRVEADGQLLHEGDMLTLSLACGRYIGGGFQCAPRSRNDDGFMELALVKPLSRLKLAGLLPVYKKGEYLEDPRLRGRIVYRQVKEARLTSDQEIILCLDGEIVNGKAFDIRVLPDAVRFILPPP